MTRSSSNQWPLWALLFALAEAVPLVALGKLIRTVEPVYLIGYLLVIWVVTAIFYGLDKWRAENDKWRIPESALHLLSIFGGWGSAYWAQRLFRHKIRKVSFQIVFWTICLIHQLLGVAYLLDWQFSIKTG